MEAEELPDISEEYGVSAVPFFVILKVISQNLDVGPLSPSDLIHSLLHRPSLVR